MWMEFLQFIQMKYFKNQTGIMTVDETVNYFPSWKLSQGSGIRFCFGRASAIVGFIAPDIMAFSLDSLFLLPFGRRARSSDSLIIGVRKSRPLFGRGPILPRLSTPRLSAIFFHRGWHEQTNQTDRTGNSWIVAKNTDTLDGNKPTRPVFRAFLSLLRVVLLLINVIMW